MHYAIKLELGQMKGIEARAGDPGAILKRWGGYFRAQALRRAASQEGWPPLAESTRKKLQQQRLAKVTSAGKVRASYGSALDRYLARDANKGSAGAAADLQELRRLRAGGAVDRAEDGRKAAAWGGSRAIDRLRKQLARAQDQRQKGKRATVGGKRRKADKHKLLGQVATAIVWKLEGTSVKAFGRVPFSAVHNDGGSAGHGASEPQRVFLAVDAQDRVVLVDIVRQQLLGTR